MEHDISNIFFPVYTYDAFASYNSRDADIVDNICSHLTDYHHFHIWKDDWELAGGDNWIDKLPEAIAGSKCVMVFIGSNGLGPWHKKEIEIALMRAVEDKSIRLIPVALPEAPKVLPLPAFAKVFHVVDCRDISDWSLHQLRCAIVGAKPGRRSAYECNMDNSPPKYSSKINISELKANSYNSSHSVSLRVGNTHGNETIILSYFTIRIHRRSPHPTHRWLTQLAAPIGSTSVQKDVYLSSKSNMSYNKLKRECYLRKGEVEDIKCDIKFMGMRAVVSVGISWRLESEQLYRLTEVGYLGLGCSGPPKKLDYTDITNCEVHEIIVKKRSDEQSFSYHPGQKNCDTPRFILTPDWPDGWPQDISENDLNDYNADEIIALSK